MKNRVAENIFFYYAESQKITKGRFYVKKNSFMSSFDNAFDGRICSKENKRRADNSFN